MRNCERPIATIQSVILFVPINPLAPIITYAKPDADPHSGQERIRFDEAQLSQQADVVFRRIRISYVVFSKAS